MVREIKISQEEYDRLIKVDRKMDALEKGGVDNWEWYSESLAEIFKEEQQEEAIKSAYFDFTDAIYDHISHDYPAGMDAGASYNISNDFKPMFVKLISKLFGELKEIDEENG